jgi:glycosyltransferase involved in cell wall biosynthesis
MLVSAIMPTRGRCAFARQALACFQSQTYGDMELVVIDDAKCPSFPDGLHLRNVQYHLVERRLSIGAKRNLACSRAQGRIIAHWDSDDWSAPERTEDQVIRLLDAGLSVTGYSNMYFTDGSTWLRYHGAPERAIGTSLMYTREWWEANPFNVSVVSGEDVAFSHTAASRKQLVTADARLLMYATNHADNTSPRVIAANSRQWERVANPGFHECAVLREMSCV